MESIYSSHPIVVYFDFESVYKVIVVRFHMQQRIKESFLFGIKIPLC